MSYKEKRSLQIWRIEKLPGAAVLCTTRQAGNLTSGAYAPPHSDGLAEEFHFHSPASDVGYYTMLWTFVKRYGNIPTGDENDKAYCTRS